MTLFKQNLHCLKSLMLFVTPFVTTLSITISPSLAATFASSETKIELKDFSFNPEDTAVLTDTFTNTVATNGQVDADANAFASFLTNIFPPLSEARNTSFSNANGTGIGYFGLGQSFAGVIGYNFFIPKGQTFSFNFNADLDLKTSIDSPEFEFATARGNLLLELFDTLTGKSLDSLVISSSLETIGSNDFLNYQSSANISLIPDITKTFGGTEELVAASFKGRYSRTFDNPTFLTLVEVKSNEVRVTARTPESANILGLIVVGLLGIRLGIKSKRSSKLQLITNQSSSR